MALKLLNYSTPADNAMSSVWHLPSHIFPLTSSISHLPSSLFLLPSYIHSMHNPSHWHHPVPSPTSCPKARNRGIRFTTNTSAPPVSNEVITWRTFMTKKSIAHTVTSAQGDHTVERRFRYNYSDYYWFVSAAFFSQSELTLTSDFAAISTNTRLMAKR